MIAFIKDHNINNIRKKLIILYLLNVSDIIFTLALLRTGMFREINIFMINAVENTMLSILLKIIFPAGILYYLYKRVSFSDKKQLHAANIGILISLTMYSLVNLSHMLWVVLLPLFYSAI